jgi:hypothetical protein
VDGDEDKDGDEAEKGDGEDEDESRDADEDAGVDEGGSGGIDEGGDGDIDKDGDVAEESAAEGERVAASEKKASEWFGSEESITRGSNPRLKKDETSARPV